MAPNVSRWVSASTSTQFGQPGELVGEVDRQPGHRAEPRGRRALAGTGDPVDEDPTLGQRCGGVAFGHRTIIVVRARTSAHTHDLGPLSVRAALLMLSLAIPVTRPRGSYVHRPCRPAATRHRRHRVRHVRRRRRHPGRGGGPGGRRQAGWCLGPLGQGGHASTFAFSSRFITAPSGVPGERLAVTIGDRTHAAPAPSQWVCPTGVWVLTLSRRTLEPLSSEERPLCRDEDTGPSREPC